MITDPQPLHGKSMAAADPIPETKITRSKALHRLKAILLRHAEHIHESAQNGSAIVTVLQSLLRCAEMRYRCCMLDDCDHASFSQAPAAVTTKTLRDGVGGNVCCAAAATGAVSAPTVTTINTSQSNSFDGGGGDVKCSPQTAENVASAVSAVVIGHAGVFMATAGQVADSFSSDADVTDCDEKDDEHDDEDETHCGGAGDEVDCAARSFRSLRGDSSGGSYTTADEGYDVSLKSYLYSYLYLFSMFVKSITG